MRCCLLLVSVVPLVLAAGPVLAASQTDFADCQQMQDPDRSITGCSKLVGDQSLVPHDRAIAYFDRGVAYYAEEDLDGAIADWSEAIKLDPNYAHAYNNRAKAYRAKGDYQHAITDYNEAVTLDPHHALAYKGRGIAYLLSGQMAKAEADFQQTTNLDSEDLYALLWLDIAKRRNNEASDIAKAAAHTSMDTWPAPLVFLFAGRITPHEVAFAAQNANPLITQIRRCESYFYIGESMLAKGDKDQATDLFQHALKACPKSVDEYSASVAELKTMGKPIEAKGTVGPGGANDVELPVQEAPGASSH
jgi:lipoprotein NlpI